MSNKDSNKVDLKIDLKKCNNDEILDDHPPPLRRERSSDYGMFCDYFEDDVLNWFHHIDNKKRADLIERLASLIKYDTFVDTPHPRRLVVQSPTFSSIHPPRLGRQSSVAPSKMETFFEHHEESITPPKIDVPQVVPLQNVNESIDKYVDDTVFNVTMTRGNLLRNSNDFDLNLDDDDIDNL